MANQLLSVAEFVEKWKAGENVLPSCFAGMVGRITSGHKNNDPPEIVGLGSSSRKVTFLFGEDTIEHSFLNAKNTWELLLDLGIQSNFILHDIIIERLPIKLVFFRLDPAKGEKILPATWDGVEAFIAAHYPSVYEDFTQFKQDLMTTEYEEFEKQAGFPFIHALKQSLNYPCYTHDYYTNLPAPKTLWQFRCFLYCELRLLELFKGDGYTINAQTGVRLKEYFSRNYTIDQLKQLGEVVIEDVDILNHVPQQAM